MPLKNHSIAAEPATIIGLTSLEIVLDVLQAKRMEDENDEEDRYQPPEPLKLEKDEDQITVGDVVSSLHEYLNIHRHDIVEAIEDIADDLIDADGNELPGFEADTPLFFEDFGLEYKNYGDPHTITVFFFYRGSFGRTVEDCWKSRARANLLQPTEGSVADSQLPEAVAAIKV